MFCLKKLIYTIQKKNHLIRKIDIINIAWKRERNKATVRSAVSLGYDFLITYYVMHFARGIWCDTISVI